MLNHTRLHRIRTTCLDGKVVYKSAHLECSIPSHHRVSCIIPVLFYKMNVGCAMSCVTLGKNLKLARICPGTPWDICTCKTVNCLQAEIQALQNSAGVSHVRS